MNLRYKWDIIGHQKQLAELEQDLAQNNLSHAYLVSGPQQVGKFSVMKTLAKILQCENNFCHVCQICHHIEKGYHPDTIELTDDGESIKIDQIRELIMRLNTTTQSKYQVVLIQNVERMTLESSNALLKTLEDPPPNVIFLLTTSNLKALLATIISRVRLLKFQNLQTTELADFLKIRYPEKNTQELEALTSLALGKPGKVIQLAENDELFRNYKKMYEELILLMDKEDRVERFLYVATMIKEELPYDDFFQVFLAVARQELLKLSAQNELDEGLVKKRVKLILDLQKTADLLQRNINARLALENLMLAL
jgi:DNA polymerase-3 subunit delta'